MNIAAPEQQIGERFSIAPSARVRAGSITVGRDVVIEDDVEVFADAIALGDGCRVAAGTSLVSPRIAIAAGATIGRSVLAELNEHLTIGSLSQVGDRVRIIGQGLTAGERLWMTDDVRVGGGGARSVDAYLTIGERAAVMDRCVINLCHRVTIGDDSALSNNVVILTHTVWHASLAGGSPVFAPVQIGRDVIVFVNAVIAPGVTVGDYVTIAANALVLRDVPGHSLALGNPARAIRLVPRYPRELSDERKDALVRSALADYVNDLPVKGLLGELTSPDAIVVTGDGWSETIRYLPYGETRAHSTADADVTLACRPVVSNARGWCHFDLAAGRAEGDATRVSEDLRDYFRRRTIRVFADRPFRSLPQANIARLRRLSVP